MRPRWLRVWVILVFGIGLGCADNNLFSSLADDDSRQAKLEEAQDALDSGDCQKALDLFGELLGHLIGVSHGRCCHQQGADGGVFG